MEMVSLGRIRGSRFLDVDKTYAMKSDCRATDSPIDLDRPQICQICSDTGVVAGLMDCPSLESKSWCHHCEKGRRLIERTAKIVAHDLGVERSTRKSSRISSFSLAARGNAC